MSNPRAADDFATIRARMEELRREREEVDMGQEPRSATPGSLRGESAAERRRRERIDGCPPPWVPTIFLKQPRR